ncbi:Transcriptional regulator PadR-like family protein [Clavibacter michiganensis]|uniref:Transcriptional regulator PadR-like family protein n=1 Tax=Clavibacter michiganensis TaxID=28447 RepID=A0A251Y1D7_9MICO|nr:PadR family transcriptional regulator [Clavibacter michiganensis]OUE17853.1 Transcriptional regulator PadR-like family protein [Clavibacter michiganensis]OUE30386.1 Transcriptional regulator PadR-like family protein [Clavibacter michiganensis]
MASDSEKILTNLRKGVLESCVLAALAGGPQYGRSLVSSLSEKGLLAGEGTIYPLLLRLRDAGLVTSELTDPIEGRRRRYHSLTARGRARLEEFRIAWAPFRTTVDDLLETRP